MSELVAILSSYNRAALIESALGSLLQAVPEKSAVVVIDAGSADGSVGIVRRLAGRARNPVHVIERKGISFAMGVNLAVREATERHPAASRFLLFETDNFISSASTVADGLELLNRQPEVGAVGFTVQKHDGSPAGFGCARPSLLSFLLGPQLSYRLRLDRPRLEWRKENDFEWSKCEVVYTSPILIRREAWERTNGFDAEVFPFSDCDLDWARRLKLAGFSQAVLKTSAVVHDNRQIESQWSSERALHLHRARFELLRREYGSQLERWAPLLALRHLGELGACCLDLRFGKRYFVKLRQRWKLLTRSFHCYR